VIIKSIFFRFMKIEVFECKSGVSKKGNAYNIALVKIDERMGKVFSDVALPIGVCKVKIDLSPNTEMFLTPRIRAIIA